MPGWADVDNLRYSHHEVDVGTTVDISDALWVGCEKLTTEITEDTERHEAGGGLEVLRDRENEEREKRKGGSREWHQVKEVVADFFL